MNKQSSTLLVGVIFILAAVGVWALHRGEAIQPGDPTITSQEILNHLSYLASDELQGREAGTPEGTQAARYIARQMEASGIQPGGTEGYFQKFNYISSLTLGQRNTFRIRGSRQSFQVGEDFIPLGFSSKGSLTANVVFVGYGFVIDDTITWNDYEGVDVNRKWVLILRGGPEGDNPHSPFEPHLALRKKVLLARDHGAQGVLLVTPEGDQEEDELIPLRFDQSQKGAGLPVLQIRQAVANQILQSVGTDLKTVQSRLDSTQQPQSIETPTWVSATVSIRVNKVRIANVIGIIPGSDPLLKKEYVVIGAHFDHLGLGGPGSGSLVQDTVAVHNGADDNASGTAGVLEIGEQLAARKEELKRSVLLMGFNAEEKGLLGSKYFVEHPTVPIKNVVAMINMDMIGRMKDSSLTVGGVGTSPDLKTILTELNRNYNLKLNFSEEGYGPSDHASFYTQDIPVVFFFTGVHEDYHKPSDDPDKINFEGEVTVANLVTDVALYLSQAEEKLAFTEAGPKEAQSERRRFKVTFGIIPAYASSAVGLEIDGVKSDGPADKAGMRKGDIIIAIGGKDVKDIYDYMYRLSELKPGTVVSVTIQRGTDTLELTVQL